MLNVDTQKEIIGIIEKVFSEHKICANESPYAFAEWEVEKDIILEEIKKALKKELGK